MRQPVSRGIYEYWNELRGARAAPERADIDPAAIRDLLPYSFIIEIDRECVFPIRLFGSALNALWLGERTNTPFLDLWRPEDRRGVAAAILTVIDGAIPVVGGARVEKRADRGAPDRAMDLELLMLPLRHRGKTHSRVFGALTTSDPPAWFGGESAGLLQLCSVRMIRPEERRIDLAPPAPHRPAGSAGGRPQLIVYKGGRTD